MRPFFQTTGGLSEKARSVSERELKLKQWNQWKAVGLYQADGARTWFNNDQDPPPLPYIYMSIPTYTYMLNICTYVMGVYLGIYTHILGLSLPLETLYLQPPLSLADTRVSGRTE